jgi:hypothetical protein
MNFPFKIYIFLNFNPLTTSDVVNIHNHESRIVRTSDVRILNTKHSNILQNVRISFGMKIRKNCYALRFSFKKDKLLTFEF